MLIFHKLVILVTVATLLGLWVVACGGDKQTIVNPIRISFYGDSITAGDGLNPRPVVRMTELAARKWIGVDYSQNGATVQDATEGARKLPFEAWPKQMVADDSAVIVIGYAGASAWIYPQRIREYELLLEQMIRQAQATRKIVILKGMSHIARPVPGLQPSEEPRILQAVDDFDAMTRTLAERHGLLFLDLRSVVFNGASDILDNIHPNQNYSDRLSAYCVAKINQLLASFVSKNQ